MPIEHLVDGPAEAPTTFLFAHGAGAPMDSPFMAAVTGALAMRGPVSYTHLTLPTIYSV